jgi:TniQ
MSGSRVGAGALLPVRVEPVDGEAIDSWLEATARSMDLTLSALVRRLNLEAVAHPPWLVKLSWDQLREIEYATGVLPHVAEAMTLADYDGTALQIQVLSHRLDTTFPYGPLSWSRFCPGCLAESGGRWQLIWRLGWSFACVKHQCLLVDRCPDCGERQRRYQVYKSVPPPMSCRCGRRLEAATSLEVPEGHPIVDAQQRILDVLTDDHASFGVFADTPRYARSALDVVRSLANRVLNYASVYGLAAVTAAGLSLEQVDEIPGQEPLSARSTLNPKAPMRAIETAVGVAAALDILGAPNVSAAGKRARWLVEGQNADTGPAELRSCRRDHEIAAAIVISACDPAMGPEPQLRFRTGISMPCAPDFGLPRARLIAAAVPGEMWLDWSDRILPDFKPTPVVRASLSYATLLTGSTISPNEACALLDEVATLNSLNYRLWVLRNSAYWRSTRAGLVRLSDYLDGPAPIDYQRRRRLDYSTLLPDEVWEEVCRQTGDSFKARQASTARCYLVERLSGVQAQRVSAIFREMNRRELGASMREFRRTMSDRRVTFLDEHAERFLAKLDIGEPVQWHPPLELLSGIALPERPT